MVGCPMYMLRKKLQNLKVSLKQWNQDIFGNIHDLVSEYMTKLKGIQQRIIVDVPTDALGSQEKDVILQLEKNQCMQEVFLSEKARLHWHVSGDRNTTFFHRIPKIKRSISVITTLKDEDSIITDPGDMKTWLSTISLIFSILQVLRMLTQWWMIPFPTWWILT